ncbi:hypothetical protein [Sporosarcina sp. OR05]|uniref:hypothetical protein n=1 Tax=Sporosarcina sp. OR05 TaxID=2969819 RepID=UPI00352B2A78
MTDVDLLVECKKGLGISGNGLDPLLNQKIVAVKAFMMGAGVSEEKIVSELGVGAVVLGVTDLWEMRSGEVKFSPVFFTLVNQLTAG